MLYILTYNALHNEGYINTFMMRSERSTGTEVTIQEVEQQLTIAVAQSYVDQCNYYTLECGRMLQTTDVTGEEQTPSSDNEAVWRLHLPETRKC